MQEEIDEAYEFVYKLTDLRRDEILDDTRKRAPMFARQLIAYYLKKHTTMTLAKIGQAIGKNHATVLHSIAKVSESAEQDSYVRDLKEAIDTRIAPFVYALRSKFMDCCYDSFSVPVKVDNVFRVIIDNIELFDAQKRSMESKSLYDNALRLQQIEIGKLKAQAKEMKIIISSIMK
tara:strand:- start:13514 stop:14041 length:528 start_codon:yes stop_codon:yes gene_type:complete